MKRILALTLVLVMVLSMIPMASAAVTETAWSGGYPGHDHYDNEPTVTQTATCNRPQITTYDCEAFRCDATKTKTEDMDIAHTKPNNAYDCKGYNCSVCRTAVPATADHTKPDDAAPCKDYNCDECGTPVPATADHTPNMEKATCSEDKVCTACGKVLQEKSLAHEYHNWVAGAVEKEPTCVDSGIQYMYCDLCYDSERVTMNPTGNHSYTVDQGEKVPATCQSAAIHTYKCATCTATEDRAKDGATVGGHTYTDKYEEKHANCAQPTTLYPKCDVCGVADYTAGTPEKGSSATGEHNYDSTTGLCTNKLHDGVTVCGASNITYTFTMPETASVKINQTVSVAATLTPEKSGATIAYTTGNASIATVDSNGTVTGKAVGSTTITAKVTVDGKEYTATCAVAVTNGAYIECASISVANGSSGTLAPSVKELPSGATDVKYTLTASSSAFTLDAANKKVTGKSAGYGTVTVDATYKLSGVTYDLDAITVYVGVYDDHTVDVVLKSTAPTTIKFSDSGIFSSAKFDGKAAATSATLESLLMDSNGSKISFKKGLNSDEIGTLKLNSMFDNKTEISLFSLSEASFSLNGKAGTSVLDYTIRTSEARGEVIVATGTLNITSGQQKADITYKTGFDKAVTVKESDFSTYFKSVNKSDTLDYVMFSIGTDAPEEGVLYVNNTATAANKADKNMSFYYNYNATTDKGTYKYDLANLTYVPDKTEKDAYVDYVTFTCYGESGKTLTGLLAFEVSQANPFTDVKESDYFYDAVMWAVAEGITTGQTETTFAPNAACTRAQVVTFLWRAAGEPTPKTTVNPFTDVKSTQYYYKAVLWAVEKGITTGLTATTFGPDSACTRAQVVTFLHRAAGQPSVTAFNNFTDVATNAYYYTPVLWAVKNGITNGMDAKTFGSNTTCTRGQIVTFLYRYVVD